MADLNDFNKPTGTTSYIGDVWDTVRGFFARLAKIDYTGAANVPVGAKRLHKPATGELRVYEKTSGGEDTIFDSQAQKAQGADIASASTIAIPQVGVRFNITGTNAIAAIDASWAGRIVTLAYPAGAGVQLTHSSGLAIPGSANLALAAGDEVVVVNTSGTDWKLLAYYKKAVLVRPSAFGASLVDDADAAAARATLGFPAVAFYSGGAAVSSTSETEVTGYGASTFNYGGWWDASSGRFTAGAACLAHFDFDANVAAGGTGYSTLYLRINGVLLKKAIELPAFGSGQAWQSAGVTLALSAGDYVSLHGKKGSSGVPTFAVAISGYALPLPA